MEHMSAFVPRCGKDNWKRLHSNVHTSLMYLHIGRLCHLVHNLKCGCMHTVKKMQSRLSNRIEQMEEGASDNW